MMKSAYIKDIAYYLPETIVTNEDIVKKFPEWSADKIYEKIGISERRIADIGETATDLAIKAAEKLFSKGIVNRDNIDFVLLCTQNPDYVLPTSACLIQNRLGLSTKVGALDINLGCSGYEYGLAVAKGLICGGIASNILFLTADTYSKLIHTSDKGNQTIFGDGASATVVSTEGFAEIGNFCCGTDGDGAENLIVKTRGSRNPLPLSDFEIQDDGSIKSSDNLYMNGQEIFIFTLLTVPKLVKDTLKSNDLSKEDIDLFIFHQANGYMLDHLRKKLGITDERFFINIEKKGNTVSSTVPIAICDAKKMNKLKGNILLAGFGVGYSWCGTIIKTV